MTDAELSALEAILSPADGSRSLLPSDTMIRDALLAFGYSHRAALAAALLYAATDTLVREVRGLRAALQSIADKPSLDPEGNADRARAALVPPAAESSR